MRCKESEQLILRSLDYFLTREEETELLRHLGKCSCCSQLKEEYCAIHTALKGEDMLDTKPYFWERLQPKLKRRATPDLWSLWKRWSLSAVPLAMMAVAIGAAALFFSLPQTYTEMSPSDSLLKNQNPISETKPLFEDNPEKTSLRLIFSSLEENDLSRRYFP